MNLLIHAFWALRVRFKIWLAHHRLIIEFCHDCGRQQPLVWWTADQVWDEFAHGQEPLCPQCFDWRAEKVGVLLRWVPVIDSRAAAPARTWYNR